MPFLSIEDLTIETQGFQAMWTTGPDNKNQLGETKSQQQCGGAGGSNGNVDISPQNHHLQGEETVSC